VFHNPRDWNSAARVSVSGFTWPLRIPFFKRDEDGKNPGARQDRVNENEAEQEGILHAWGALRSCFPPDGTVFW
jgi:hypothetical protein